MTAIVDRTGDFTKKKYLYKFYKNGYTSRRPKYMAAGQYMGGSGRFIAGGVSGNASMGGSVSEDYIGVTGTGDSNVGLSATYEQSTDVRRQFDLSGLIMSFAHGGGTTGAGTLYYYEAGIFDYRIRYTSSGNTTKIFYQNTELVSATMAAGYTYIRLREMNGTLYFDRSSDGVTWTNWTSRAINFSTDIIRDVLSLQLSAGAGGNGNIFANLYSISAADRHNQLLAIEGVALNDLEFEEQINNPASSTTITFPYSPLDVPPHFDQGNFVEIYSNFYDDGQMLQRGPILDHNSAAILDENNLPIEGLFTEGGAPEDASILKFSGFISFIDYDYDNELIAVTFVSHGETMNNSIVRDLTDISTAVVTQDQQNNSVNSTNYRQTFTLEKMTKIDDVVLYVSYAAGGGSSIEIGQASTVLATSRSYTWSGGRPAGAYNYHFDNSVYLEAGQYWIKETGGLQWYYQNSSVYSGGRLEVLSGGSWVDTGNDAYFIIKTSQPNFAVTLTGNSQEIAADIFARSLERDYSPLYIEYVEPTDYDFSIGLNLDSAKNAINALYRQLPSGWYYEIDVGTNALRIKNKSESFDHLLVFGRDFTGMKVTKDINNIINDVFYVGGQLVDNGPKLTTQFTDTDSIADYRHGVAILTNDKVTRYDTAQLLSENTIGNNNAPRLTTEITLSAGKYNTEAVRKGHVIKIVNGDRDVLGTTLVVASLNYGPEEITISLDSAPRNLSRTIDQIQRDLQNSATANAGNVV